MLSMTRLTPSPPGSRRPARAATSIVVCAAVLHDLAPVHEHVAHVGARSRRRRRTRARCAASVPGQADAVEADGDEVGARARLDPAGVRPPEAGVAAGASPRAAGRVAGCRPRSPRREPLVELHRTRLLEHVDDGVRVAAERERRAGVDAARRIAPMPSARSRSVVGHTQQQARGIAEQRDVVVGEVGRVHGGEVCVERTRAGEQPGRACARRPRCTPRSRRAARRRARGAAARPRAPRRRPSRAESGSTARTLWMAAPIARTRRRRRARPTRSAHASAVPSEKRRWAPSGGSPIAAVQVAGVDQA